MNGVPMVTQPAVAQSSDGIGNAMSTAKLDTKHFINQCLRLAKRIDYGIAINKPPAHASELFKLLKQACCRKNELHVESAIMVAIMVLMLSVKNACIVGWFSAKETEELLALADEVGNYFCTNGDINHDTSVLGPTLTSTMCRYYPAYKLGHVLTSFEVKPGYGTYLVDFQVKKNLLNSKDERIRLLMITKESVETSSCIISPQQVSIFVNGRPVEKRTNVIMDPRPQVPTIINHFLKDGINVIQAVGQFNGHCILVIVAMSNIQTSDLPALQDYVQPDIILPDPDSEVIVGASRISLNCPISRTRIKIPVKGHLCKHYQCFDKSNYIEINSKRPSWKCPHCNQSVGFTDLRVDQMIVQVLQEVGEDISEVTIHVDGSWKGVSSNVKDGSHDKPTNKQDEHGADKSSRKSDGQCNVFDLTGEDCEIDTDNRHAFVKPKAMVDHNIQSQSIYPISTPPSNPRSANELFDYPFSQPPNSQSSGALPGPTNYNIGIAPVLTDAASSSLNRQPNNFQVTNHPSSSLGVSQFSPTENSQLQEAFYGRFTPRNDSQALRFQTPLGTLERQYHLQQQNINACHMSRVPTVSLQSCPTSHLQVNSRMHQQLSQSPQLTRPSQTYSQSPLTMRSSQHPHSHPQQTPQVWEQPTYPSHPYFARNSSSSYSNTGFSPQPGSMTGNILESHPAEQNWQPTGQMRGAVTGEDYAATLNRMSQGSTSSMTPGFRPPATAAYSVTSEQILLANRMIAHSTRMPN